MPSFLSRLTGGRAHAPAETKAQTLFSLTELSGPSWTGRSYASLAREGMVRNPVVYRCIRMIAEAAASVPLKVVVDGAVQSEHPVAALLARPNGQESGRELMERLHAFLQTAGNAYVQAVSVEGAVKALYGLRPDRVRVVTGPDGWPLGYDYTAGGRTQRLRQDAEPVSKVLHLMLFHPLDDHDGLSPLEAAQMSLDIHNAASRWNKSLLDNAARPSGALIYSAAAGNLTADQFERLKRELEEGFQGAMNAGRPMVLEGGLDWKAIGMSPKDMDFIELKHVAAREIALAFGVPPMLLGIPGDNTYSNYAEANKALWRQTVMPLVARVAAALEHWLRPGFGPDFSIQPDDEGIEALSEDRSALWKRVTEADFLSDAEKRRMLGVSEPK
ncbi:MAG: phage portal protein [Alphaproteobacteria bacterium]|nr:phage portal protein [Alphaproteobacteria bacterium]